MGDRTNVEVLCRKEHRQRFEEFGFVTSDYDEDSYKDDPYIRLYDDECNYGGYDLLCQLASEGIPFHGYHGSGGEYNAAVFASADGEIAWPPALDGNPVAVVLQDGTAVQSDLDEAKRYYAILKRAEELLEVEHEDPNPSADYA